MKNELLMEIIKSSGRLRELLYAAEDDVVECYDNVIAGILDENVCRSLVAHGLHLNQLPDALRSVDICRFAVSVNSDNFRAVPSRHRNGAQTAEDFIALFRTAETETDEDENANAPKS